MTSNYIDTYFSRVNHLGTSTAERIRNGGMISFQKWLAESPHTVENLSTERGIHFRGIIIRKKDRPEEKIMLLHVANDININVGDIVNWLMDNGELEKWILFQEEKKANGTYQTFFMIRCNYLLKWFDSLGHLQQSWSHVVSSVDSMIKGNYRTWNSLISPQPNKYMEVIMPRYTIDRATNFIVENESWSLVEYDYTSVPGIIYLSMTENKINKIYDDLDNNIADLDREAKYKLIAPSTTQIFHVGEAITPVFTITKNNEVCEYETELISSDKHIAKIIDGVLTAVAPGNVTIIVQLKDYPFIQETIPIEISDAEPEFSAYIEGASTIKLDYGEAWKNNKYLLQGTAPINGEVVYSIEDTAKATIKTVINNVCYIQANSNNNLGEFVLKAVYNNVVYSKTITIIPLW